MKAFILAIDHSIDLITNSSSELFTIKADRNKEVLEPLVREAMDGISFGIFDKYLSDESSASDEEWAIENALSIFPEEFRQEIRDKYLGKVQYIAVVVDRDAGYDTNYKHHDKLRELGFDLITTDF